MERALRATFREALSSLHSRRRLDTEKKHQVLRARRPSGAGARRGELFGSHHPRKGVSNFRKEQSPLQFLLQPEDQQSLLLVNLQRPSFLKMSLDLTYIPCGYGQGLQVRMQGGMCSRAMTFRKQLLCTYARGFQGEHFHGVVLSTISLFNTSYYLL